MKNNTTSKARLSSRKVRIKNLAKGLTSQAGLIPVVQFLDRLGFCGLVDEDVGHKRGENAVYTLTDAVFLTTVGMVGGATSLLKVAALWSDGVLRRVGGWVRIPDDSTLGRLFKEVRGEHIAQLEAFNHRLRARVWKRALRTGRSVVRAQPTLWVDVDSTVKTVFGKPEGAAKGYNTGKRGALSYHPLLAFCCATKEILQAWLRTGSAYTGNGVVEFIKQLLAHLPNKVRIVFRGDRGFFAGALLSLLESRGHGYLVKVKLKGLAGLLSTQAWSPIRGHEGWEQCEFFHRCRDWENARRFVAVRAEKLPEKKSAQGELLPCKEYENFCYVTSEELSPWEAHKKYGERATCETWIDEAKNQMGLGQIKTGEFLANAALFQCAVLAYNTVRWMAMMSGNATLHRWEIQTVRAFLVRVAGRLLAGSRQLTSNTPKKHLFPGAWDDWVAVGLSA